MHRKIEHIEQCIVDAINRKSKLTPDILLIAGMSSIQIRHLLNNILNTPDVNYLEIGVHRGSTFISALYKNEVDSAYAIDNWILYAVENARQVFMDNCEKFGICNFRFFEEDAFHIDLRKIKHTINVYFYDAQHSEEFTTQALTHFYDILADEFIFIVDDFDWEGPPKGALKGVQECGLRILHQWHLKSNCGSDNDSWWNGIGIFVLKKTK